MSITKSAHLNLLLAARHPLELWLASASTKLRVDAFDCFSSWSAKKDRHLGDLPCFFYGVLHIQRLQVHFALKINASGTQEQPKTY